MVYIFSVLVFFAFMLQRFISSHVSLIMIKLFRGWELVNNAARSSLYDAQHTLLLLMSLVCRKLLLHQFSNSKHEGVQQRFNAKLATLPLTRYERDSFELNIFEVNWPLLYNLKTQFFKTFSKKMARQWWFRVSRTAEWGCVVCNLWIYIVYVVLW